MPIDDLVTTAEAAKLLGLSPSSVKYAIARGVLRAEAVHNRLNLVRRDEVERYRREHLGQRGKRQQPDAALTEQQRKHREYQRAYYQRKKAARTQKTQPAEPAEE